MKLVLRDVSPELIEKMLDIEIQIIPFLEMIGIFLTRDDLKNEIMKDLNQIVVLSFKGSELAGLLRYARQENHLFIKSIALNPRIGAGAFPRLIPEVLSAIDAESLESIESVVQISNRRSITMHKKLGFHKLKENSKSIRFGIGRVELLENFKIRYGLNL